MKGKRYGQEQIVYALKRVEAGAKGGEVCRELGVSEATLYVWRKKHGGLGVAELGRLRQLEEENQRLKEAGGGPVAGQTHPAGGVGKKV